MRPSAAAFTVVQSAAAAVQAFLAIVPCYVGTVYFSFSVAMGFQSQLGNLYIHFVVPFQDSPLIVGLNIG